MGDETDPLEHVEDSGESFTIDEILGLDHEAEKQAEALLGGQDENVCSYSEGYKYRQPLYSCLTCAKENDGKQAGVCYACSINCHADHELIELYTKRKFCCDCGNSRFKAKCKLFLEKLPVNALNAYNHNFEGLYCTCRKPYPPDADDTDPNTDDMHSCLICEDWFHLSHIYTDPEEKEALEKLQQNLGDACELVCKACVARLPFLLYYEILNHEPKTTTTASEETTYPVSDDEQKQEPSSSTNSECKLKKLELDHGPQKARCIYFDGYAWREQLCKCNKCLELYEDMDCKFLIDPEDTMEFYDAQNLENMKKKGEIPIGSDKSTVASSAYNLILKETNNRDAALYAYTGIEQMSSHIGEFIKKMSNKVITPRDVDECFQELRAKRARLDPPSESSDAAWTE